MSITDNILLSDKPTQKQIAYLSYRLRDMGRMFTKVERPNSVANYIYVELEQFIKDKMNKKEITLILSLLDEEKYEKIKTFFISRGFFHFK